jgi:hypothetical protein
MGRFNKKIYSGKLLVPCFLTLSSILSLFSFSSAAAESEEFEKVTMKKFISPKFNAKATKLEYLISGKNARTIGAFVKIDDAKIEMISEDGKNVTSVVTTPEAFYNRTTEKIKGDKPIHYQSLTAIIDGVGFDSDLKKKFLHIRRNVKMLITSMDEALGKKDKSDVQPVKENADQAETVNSKMEENSTGQIDLMKTENDSSTTAANQKK